MAVELETKRCCCCKQEKPAKDFYTFKQHKDGLASRCKACHALRTKQLAARPTIHVDQKVCSGCKERKAASEFSKDASQRDGLRYLCRKCLTAYKTQRLQRQLRIPTTKVCCQCGIEKAAHEYTRDHTRRDGLRILCKECDKLSARARTVTKKCTTKAEREAWNMLVTWQQVPELLREMAELQLNVNNLNTDCKRRVAMIQKETAQAQLPYVLRQTKLHFMLEGFVMRSPERFLGIRKSSLFGTVIYSGHKLIVHLNTEFAARKIGKPLNAAVFIA